MFLPSTSNNPTSQFQQIFPENCTTDAANSRKIPQQPSASNVRAHMRSNVNNIFSHVPFKGVRWCRDHENRTRLYRIRVSVGLRWNYRKKLEGITTSGKNMAIEVWWSNRHHFTRHGHPFAKTGTFLWFPMLIPLQSYKNRDAAENEIHSFDQGSKSPSVKRRTYIKTNYLMNSRTLWFYLWSSSLLKLLLRFPTAPQILWMKKSMNWLTSEAVEVVHAHSRNLEISEEHYRWQLKRREMNELRKRRIDTALRGIR